MAAKARTSTPAIRNLTMAFAAKATVLTAEDIATLERDKIIGTKPA